MIDYAFAQILINDAGVSSLVGDEIHPSINPERSGDYIVYQKIIHERPAAISNEPSKQHAVFQVDIYSKRLSDVLDISEAVISAVHYQSNTSYGHNIQLMRLDSERSEYESSVGLFRSSLDISLFFD